MICAPCRAAEHEQCVNPECVTLNGDITWYGTWCDCQHKPRGDGLVITGTLEG